MESLSVSDLRRLLSVLAELAGTEAEALPAQILAGLQRLIPCDTVSYNAVDPVHSRNFGLVEPAGVVSPELIQCFERHIAEHPIIANYMSTGDGQALRLSDFLSQREFHRLGLWAEFFRLLRVEHQLAVVVPIPSPLVVGLALDRSRCPFTDRERALLELARPHLGAIFRQAELRALLAHGLTATGWEVVRVGRDGRISAMSDRAGRLLATYDGGSASSDRRLPATLDGWARRQSGYSGGPSPAFAADFVLSGPRGQLVVRFLPGGTAGAEDLLLLREQLAEISPRALAGRGLSRREAEVAAAVAEGQTNDAVAKRLGIRVGTVEKHLTHTYDKLGLASRTALASWVRQVVLDPV